MSSYVVVKRYEEDGVTQTYGYEKILTALQAYEMALEDFEEYVERGWKRYLEEIANTEPTFWDKVKGTSIHEKYLANNQEAEAFGILESLVRTRSYRYKMGVVRSVEPEVGVDIARWFPQYSELRALIRCGLEYHLDAKMAKFINRFNQKDVSCFR